MDTTVDGPMLKWGTTYTFIVREADPLWIWSADASNGRLYRQDSIITVHLPASRSTHRDSLLIQVSFRPGAHTDENMIRARYYIDPDLKPYVRPSTKRSGLYVTWGNPRTWHMSSEALFPLSHFWYHITRSQLSATLYEKITYKDYDSRDTSLRSLDSLYVRCRNHRENKWYRYHIPGTSLSAESADQLHILRLGSLVRIQMYYHDPDSPEAKSKTLRILLHRRNLGARQLD